MSKVNPLRGLVGYGDSDDSGDEEGSKTVASVPNATSMPQPASENIHPAPIPHCPWSACYDEGSGFTYYWNQQTNAVTWEAPPEYLLALKVARQQLNITGSGEVSAEEWQLYQQALAEKQQPQLKKPTIAFKPDPKPVSNASNTKSDKINKNQSNGKSGVKRRMSDEEPKIELITSYYDNNSDSDSNDESLTPVKKSPPKPPAVVVKPKELKIAERPVKKQKTKPVLEYGPSLPPNQEYTIPIGPELPPNLNMDQVISVEKSEVVEKNTNIEKSKSVAHDKSVESQESVDKNNSIVEVIEEKLLGKSSPIAVDESDDTLLKKLKDKAKLLEKLGGELPKELQEIISEEIRSRGVSPVKTVDESSRDTKSVDNNLDIDDLLEEIEKKELPKIRKPKSDEILQSNMIATPENSPKGSEIKPLFPSSANIDEQPALFPSAVNTETSNIDLKADIEKTVAEKKGPNLYLLNANDVEIPTRKKLRISHSVLPPKERREVPSYTTKYSNQIEGFTTERTGLGFNNDTEDADSPKNTVSYGNGLTFTKGEVLNDGVIPKEDDLEDMLDLVEAKLKFLNQQQASTVTPVQEMLIQLQTLWVAVSAGGATRRYVRGWARAALGSLSARELAAAPPGWRATFLRSEGRYQYKRLSDGLTQWEYPATTNTDMDICTTPPHPSQQDKEEDTPPPLPPPAVAPPPPPAVAPPPPPAVVPPLPPCASAPPAPPPPTWSRARTPPPPAWSDPPPPGTEDAKEEPKKEITDELLSFYNDIAELEKPPAPAQPPLPPLPPPETTSRSGSNSPVPTWPVEDKRRKEESKTDVKLKKKSKVKISSSIGMKHKSVSNLVAKWQQVAEEINSD